MSKLNLVLNFLVISLMAAGADAYAACTNSVRNSAPDCTGLISNSVSSVLTNTSTGTIAVTGDFEFGIHSQAPSSTNINSGTITTTGDISAGIRSEVGPSTNINSGTITTTGDISAGILSYGGININSGNITTAGELASGIEIYADSAIANNSGTITTTGLHAYGIAHSGDSTTTNNLGGISTNGQGSYGIFILNSAGVVNNYGNISTLGFESAGIYTLGDNAQIQNSGTIHTTADNAAGISSHGNNAIITNTGSIITEGDDSPSPHISADGIASYGNAANITNSGHITTSGPSAYGIYLIGNVVAVTNTGTISASGPDSHGLYSEASNASINNTGLISSEYSNGIFNSGTIANLTNKGTIASTFDFGIVNEGVITALSNSGSIYAYNSTGIRNFGFIGEITNTNLGSIIGAGWDGIENGENHTIHSIINEGTIQGYFSGLTTRLNSVIDSLNNSGDIYGENSNGIYHTGNITLITNSGTIYTAGNDGIYLRPESTIQTLSNTGAIYGSAGRYGIVNSGALNTLNNAQGGDGHTPATTALGYSGHLPANYNIIIDSSSHYGQLDGLSGTPSGATTFGIYAGSNVTSRLYSSVLLGVIGQVNHLSGLYDNMNWTLLQNGNNYDLSFDGISLSQTQASIASSANRLRSIFNTAAISTNFANMNTYDCNLFDTKGMCISAGGRYTTVDNPSANSSSAVVVVGYKASPNIRIGGFLDQNFNTTSPTGIHIANKNPMMGAFAVWNQKEDGLGLQVKVANAYQDKDINITRDAVGTSEAGTGSTKLNTQSYVVEFSYAAKDQYDTLVRPYLALRYTNIKQDGYTETGISTPLTYDPLTDKSTSALFGVKFNRAITAKANITASLGLELDLQHSVDQYTATSAGISGLTSENFNNDIHRTRPVASLGAYYALTKTQRISGDVYYQQLPFQSTGSTTAYFNYMIGL